MLFGLFAALAWGLADFLAAVIARRLGSLVTAVVALVAAAAQLGLLLVFAGASIGVLQPWDVAFLLIVGAFQAIAFGAFYRGLVLGPVSLVATIGACYALVVVVLSLVILRESVPMLALAGAAITLAGIPLMSIELKDVSRRWLNLRSGLPYGLAAMLLFGGSAFLVAEEAKRFGWFAPVLVTRMGSAMMMLLLMAVLRPRWSGPSTRRWLLGAAAGAGTLDVVGYSLYALGSERGFVSIVAAASATYPVIPILGGVFLLRERLAPNQLVGVLVALAGLVLMAMNQQ